MSLGTLFLFTSFSVLALSCGPIMVDHVVSGEVAVKLSLTKESFLAFSIVECQLRKPGQLCYNEDPLVCGECLSAAIYDSLGVAQ